MFQENIINIPILINNEKVILIEDNINSETENQDSLIIDSGVDEVTVNSEKLDTLKEGHADHNFYGFWSTLLLSGIVEADGLQIYYVSDEDGYYIYTRESKVIETGVVVGSHIPSGYKLDVSNARLIEIDIGNLVLPREFIKSAGDIYREQGQQKTILAQSIIRAAFFALIILIILGSIFEYMEEDLIQEKVNDKRLLTNLTSLFRQQQGATNFLNLDQNDILDKVLNINNVSAGNFKIPKQNIDKKGKVAIMSSEVPNPESALKKGITIKRYEEERGWILEW